MELITIECMNFKPHEAHTWREGFLWLTKKTCGGVPEHRHNLRFAPTHSDHSIMTWRCKKPGCREAFSFYRPIFMNQTLDYGWPWRK